MFMTFLRSYKLLEIERSLACAYAHDFVSNLFSFSKIFCLRSSFV